MTVKADVQPSVDLFGKTVTDLQENVVVGRNDITGTLKYVTGYTGFSSKPEEQSGNYLVIRSEVPDAEDATITVEVVGGTKGPVTLDSDGIMVARIANKQQKIRVVASLDGYDFYTRTFVLSGLTLASE